MNDVDAMAGVLIDKLGEIAEQESNGSQEETPRQTIPQKSESPVSKFQVEENGWFELDLRNSFDPTNL